MVSVSFLCTFFKCFLVLNRFIMKEAAGDAEGYMFSRESGLYQNRSTEKFEDENTRLVKNENWCLRTKKD